jgi:Tfp pilus assembly protein PilO
VNALVSRVTSSRRSSAITAGLVIVLVAAAAWFGVVSPKRSHASQLKNEIAAAQVQLATARQTAAVANKAATAAALEALPDAPDQPGILDQLNRIGKSSGVVVATVTPSPALTPTSVPLSVTVDGNYFQIRNFLKKLHAQVRVGNGGRIVATGRLFDVQNVAIAQGTAANQLAATIALNASVYAPPVPAAATAATTATASGAGGSTG